METPSMGRIVIYRSRTGNYSLPAIVTCTQETRFAEGDIPELSSPTHLHLHVLTPGAQGSYTEHDVPLDEDFGPIAGADDSQAPGTWRWPVRV